MSEFLPLNEVNPNAATAGVLGEVALPRADVFEPGTVGAGIDIVTGTLGHSGDGGDGSQKYHTGGNVRTTAEVPFS